MTSAAVRRAIDAAFTPRRTRPCVGLELELFPIDAATGAPVPVERTKSALGRLNGLVCFEPGGQVELSPACCPSVSELLGRTHAAWYRLESACEAAGILLVASGMHPTASAQAIGLQIRSSRYVEMQRHFDRVGAAGRSMMRATASLQVCIDWLPGAEVSQWNAAVAAAPVLAAMFGSGGDGTARTRVWTRVDPLRTSFDGRLHGEAPQEAYEQFAVRAPVIRVSPAPADPIGHHLSTLFPMVRPRGYLELRAMDAQPRHRVDEAVRTAAALLTDRDAVAGVLEVLGSEPDDTAERWRIAASTGLASSQLLSDVLRLRDIAASRRCVA